MLSRPPRVAAIHDLSGFGRCSLTVILPTLSAMGIQVCPVPTAVLSTHLGGFGEVESRDLTDFISPCFEHYKKINLDFESVYTGFLATAEQIDHCLEFIEGYNDAFVVVDPVMGDHGKAYSTYTATMIRRIGELVSKADLITPNLTEACMLLKQNYQHEPLTRDTCKKMLLKLSEKGPKYVVITGVPMATGTTANIGYDRDNNSFWISSYQYVPVSFPGTGDIYASVLLGGFLSGDSLPIAMARATDFCEIAVKTTFGYGSDTRYGVMLEKVLHTLWDKDTAVQNYSIL